MPKATQASFDKFQSHKDESAFNAQIDDIFAELHEADDRIAKDREDIMYLARETRAMLTDLRKQLG